MKQSFFYVPSAFIGESLILRTYIPSSVFFSDELSESVQNHGILGALPVVKLDNSTLFLLDGVRRVLSLKKTGQEQVPLYCVSESADLRKGVSLSLSMINLLNQNFMDWAVLLRNLEKLDMIQAFWSELKKMIEITKYPLKVDLVTRVFQFPALIQDLIFFSRITWKVVYYLDYFSSEEWEMLAHWLCSVKLNANSQRNVLEKLVLWKNHSGLADFFEHFHQNEHVNLDLLFKAKLSPEKMEMEGRWRSALSKIPGDIRKILQFEPDYEKRAVKVSGEWQPQSSCPPFEFSDLLKKLRDEVFHP